jgi:hypothetical protein
MSDVQILTSADLRARVRALRDLTANRAVVTDGALRHLIKMHDDVVVPDIHTILGGRAVRREAKRRHLA